MPAADSLRSKRFRLVSEQKKTVERIFGFDRARSETRTALLPFLAQSLILVPHSLLLNRTETLAMQARQRQAQPRPQGAFPGGAGKAGKPRAAGRKREKKSLILNPSL